MSEAQDQRSHQTQTVALAGTAGCYVYCVAPSAEAEELGNIGLEGLRVRTVPDGGLCALVHDCPAQPYRSTGEKASASWVLAHHRVVQAAWERWSVVLPVAFNTIIAPGPDEQTAEANLRAWLQREHTTLREKLKALGGRAEYGLQVFWDSTAVAGKVVREDEELRQMMENSQAQADGTAYMHRHLIERRVKAKMEALAAYRFSWLYDQLKTCVERIQVEKSKDAGPGSQMIINLSCLVNIERRPDLEAIVAKMSQEEGHTIRLAGPLPPYSFS